MKSRLTPARVLVFSLIAGTMQFGLAMIVLGGWTAFFSHPALIALTVGTLGMMVVTPLSNVNLSCGEREDRANRWIFTAFSLIALASAILPPYTDRIGLWTIDGETTCFVQCFHPGINSSPTGDAFCARDSCETRKSVVPNRKYPVPPSSGGFHLYLLDRCLLRSCVMKWNDERRSLCCPPSSICQLHRPDQKTTFAAS